MADYEISTDPARLDFEFIVRSLQSTYWAADRSRDVIVASFQSSLAFGAYHTDTGAQVAVARIVGDGLTFSWLCDVFVSPEHRGHGLGKRLVAAVIAHPQVRATRMCLATRDAHGLYEKFGFERQELMRRRPTDAPINPAISQFRHAAPSPGGLPTKPNPSQVGRKNAQE